MLENLNESEKSNEQEIDRTRDALSVGWRELFNHSSTALTSFIQPKDELQQADSNLAPYLCWSLLAGEVEETKNEIVVRLEVSGMKKQNIQFRIEGKKLFLNGKKLFERSSVESDFHLMERAYGTFQRVVPLPKNVLEDKARATYQNGVLTVRLTKLKVQRLT